MRVLGGNLEIRSDSEYVVHIATGLLQGERQLNNEGIADLWDEFFGGAETGQCDVYDRESNRLLPVHSVVGACDGAWAKSCSGVRFSLDGLYDSRRRDDVLLSGKVHA